MPVLSTQLEITPSRRFATAAVLVLNAYGLLLVVPVLASMLVVSLLKLSALTFLIPALALGLATCFLPFGVGNPYVARLVGPKPSGTAEQEQVFLVQLTLTPRIQHGVRALLEDADDFGWLRVNPSGLIYEGDAVKLSIRRENIRGVRAQTIGWRGLFVYGPRASLEVAGLPNVTAVVFAERSSCFLAASRRNAGRLNSQLRALRDQSPVHT